MLPFFFREGSMAKASLGRMSVNELLRLRTEVTDVLNSRVDQLRDQLTRLGEGVSFRTATRRSLLKGRKAPIKYRDRSGNTWAGRGAQPVWLREKLKAGAKIEDFAVDKKAAPRKSRKKASKKRRKSKQKR